MFGICEFCGEETEVHLTRLADEVAKLSQLAKEVALCDGCYEDLLLK